ncbi:MAG: hypothetical protein ACOZIN_20380 [Myxococcota bacterium]
MRSLFACWPWVLLWCVLAIACRTLSGPEQVTEAYARALAEGRLDDAYALTSAAHRAEVSQETFRAHYADPQARVRRAEAILSSLPTLRAHAQGLDAVREGEVWRVEDLFSTEGPREVLARFLDAVEAGDFPAAYAMLSGAWRARYTPERLAEDFAAEPLARERVARARAALFAEWVWKGDVAEASVGDGKAVKLLREAGAFKVAALE